MKKAFTLGIALVAMVGLVGCAGPAEGVKTTSVSMTGFMTYAPASITVDSGDTVTWKNDSLVVHTVTADPAIAKRSGDAVLPAGAAPFNSGNIDPGKTFSYTFVAPGTYKYFCIPHEMMGMVGTVIVRETTAARPATPAPPKK